MFTEALKAKADSCLNIEDYEMVTFPPGRKYDKNAMDVETKDGVRCRTGNFEGKVVELCIQAAVYASPRKELSRDSSIAEAVIPTRNFVARTERQRADLRPFFKGVVILAD
jgi:hypothetical protein